MSPSHTLMSDCWFRRYPMMSVMSCSIHISPAHIVIYDCCTKRCDVISVTPFTKNVGLPLRGGIRRCGRLASLGVILRWRSASRQLCRKLSPNSALSGRLSASISNAGLARNMTLLEVYEHRS